MLIELNLYCIFIGDYLLYETYQASPDQTVALTNHSIVFYYIDGMFITYVHFILFDVS